MSVEEKLRARRLVPVAVVERLDDGLGLCAALQTAGLPVIEVTFRTAVAADLIREVSATYPDFLLGAGTILTCEDLDRAMAAGAHFAVSPGSNPRVIAHAQAANFPFFPGVCTPSDIERGLELGLRTFKFFPAEAAGGAKMLKSLIAPYRHLGIQFCPTGGINADNCKGYLAIDEVVAIGGSWMVPGAQVSAHDWSSIEQLTADAVALAGR